MYKKKIFFVIIDADIYLQLSISPIPETDGCCTHSTPYKSEQVLLQDSLYAELRASVSVENICFDQSTSSTRAIN